MKPRKKLCNDCNVNKATVFYGIGERCEPCAEIKAKIWHAEQQAEWARHNEAMLNHVCGEDEEVCEECCAHDEHDHGICMDCEKDISDELCNRAHEISEGER